MSRIVIGELFNISAIESNESLEGYIFRLAYLNGYDNKLTTKLINQSYKNEKGLTPLIATLTNSTIPTELEKLSLKQLSENRILVLKGNERKFTRYCPLCLKEKKYHRVYWSINPVINCYLHRIQLNNECLNCKKGVTVMDISSDCICSNCYVPLYETSYQEIEFIVESPFNYEELLGNSNWNGLDYLQYFNLITRIALGIDDQGTKSIMRICGNSYQITDYTKFKTLVAFTLSIMQDWPKSFTQFLEMYNVFDNPLIHSDFYFRFLNGLLKKRY